jgi:hypothetical protein
VGVVSGSILRVQEWASRIARRARSGLVATPRHQVRRPPTVAARMGTSESAVARMEGGALDARISTVARFAAAVGVRLQVAATPARPPRKAA